MPDLRTVVDQLKSERARLLAEVRRVDSAIAVLLPGAKAVGVPGRKPMSEDARRRIAEGLKKARDARAAEAKPAPPVKTATKKKAEGNRSAAAAEQPPAS